MKNPTRSLLPFDPVSTQMDPNGFMEAPMWFGNYEKNEGADAEVWRQCDDFPYKDWSRQRVTYGVRSSCTQQASFDVPKVLTHCLLASAFGVLHGHVNWVPATYVGKLRFQDISSDSDLDLQLRTIGDLDSLERFPGNESFGSMKVPPILTKDSQIDKEYKDALWLEFASYETVKYFRSPAGDNSWQLFTAGRKKEEYQAVQKQYQDHTAIVTGLLNLDCVHECHTELHPVFAMALRAKSEVEYVHAKKEQGAKSIADDDPWLIFVRNAGNEGDCSQDEHYLNRTEYTFFLPAPPRCLERITIFVLG